MYINQFGSSSIFLFLCYKKVKVCAWKFTGYALRKQRSENIQMILLVSDFINIKSSENVVVMVSETEYNELMKANGNVNYPAVSDKFMAEA